MGSSGWPKSSPKSINGISRFSFLILCSAHPLNLTKRRIFASFGTPWASRMASFTLAATCLLKAGSINSARGGARLFGGKHKRAIVRSRSCKNSGLLGARGARWVFAKARAADMSPSGSEVQLRINSISWRRRREKCKDEFVSSIYPAFISQYDSNRLCKRYIIWYKIIRIEDWSF